MIYDSPPHAVFFDLDGTILDSAPDFIHSVNWMRKKHHLDRLPDDKIRSLVSNGARALIQLAFGVSEENPAYPALRSELLEIYDESLCRFGGLFDGASELFSILEAKHIPWGIVTNKPRYYSEKLLKILQLEKNCLVLVCPEDLSKSKPDPEGVLLAAKAANCLPEHCLYVGDHIRDIQAGKNAGMKTASAYYGYADSPDIISSWNADYIIYHLNELSHWINQKR